MTNLEEWDDSKPVVEISVEQMDQAVKNLRAIKDKYTEENNKAKEIYAQVKEHEAQVISMLKQAGKSKYIVEGVGSISLTDTLSYQTPKTPEQKQSFFNWLKEEEGDDGYWAYATVNSNSLNSLLKQKVDEYGDRGEVLEIDGMEPPTSYTKLSLRKA